MKKAVFVAMASAMAAAMPRAATAEDRTAIFAGGCFWCMEKDFEHVPGVRQAVSGYIGGTLPNPTYRNHEGHVEAIRVTYDDTVVSYAELLHTFWRTVNPTDEGGQFCDRGFSYTTAIFALDGEQLAQAQASKKELEASGKLDRAIVTPIRMATLFTVAEDYHQGYYKKNPVRYAFYRKSCGRDAAIKRLWGDEAHAGVDYDS